MKKLEYFIKDIHPVEFFDKKNFMIRSSSFVILIIIIPVVGLKVVHQDLSIVGRAVREHYLGGGFGHSSLIENDPIVVSVLLFFLLIFNTNVVIKHKWVLGDKTGKLVVRIGLIVRNDILV